VLKYDPELAKRLLAEAGYAGGVTVTMWTPEGRYVLDRQVAEAVAGALQNVGVRVQLRVWGDYPSFSAALFQRKEPVDMALVGFAPVSGDPDVIMSNALKTGSIFNFYGYSNPEVDRLADAGRQIVDLRQRQANYDQLVKTFWNDVPWLNLHFQQIIVGIRSGGSGFFMFPWETYDLRELVFR
jgi:peptide/nickel transport system substrate-binding protein